jgi:hypothetical protein
VPTEEKKKEMKGKKPTRVTVHRIVNGKKIPFYVLDDASKFRPADWYVNGLLGTSAPLSKGFGIMHYGSRAR